MRSQSLPEPEPHSIDTFSIVCTPFFEEASKDSRLQQLPSCPDHVSFFDCDFATCFGMNSCPVWSWTPCSNVGVRCSLVVCFKHIDASVTVLAGFVAAFAAHKEPWFSMKLMLSTETCTRNPPAVHL
eukprot:1335571-Amphidinium_carterae.1